MLMSASGGTPRVVLIAGKLTAFDDPLAAPPPRNLYRVNVRCPIPMHTPRRTCRSGAVFVRRQVGRIPVQLTAVADAFEQTPPACFLFRVTPRKRSAGHAMYAWKTTTRRAM